MRCAPGSSRHKCLGERSKPVSIAIDRGATQCQCQTCRRWFRSKSGLTAGRNPARLTQWPYHSCLLPTLVGLRDRETADT